MPDIFPKKLTSLPRFWGHMARSIGLAIVLVFIALLMGMCGYHYFEALPWVDAFTNASMILSGMGPLAHPGTTNGKIFAGLYALFSGLFFIIIMGLILAPILHRFFHKLKLEEESKRNE